MDDLLHVHRRILNDANGSASIMLQHIYYSFTHDGLVDIHKMSAHYVNQNRIIGENILGDDYELTLEEKLGLLNILLLEEIIEI